MCDADDFFPWDYFDEWESEPEAVTCMFCKVTGFQWDTCWVEGVLKHVLVDGRNRVHNCRAATPSEFEDLTNVQSTPTSSTSAGRRPVSRPGNPAGTRSQAARRPHKNGRAKSVVQTRS